MQAQSISNMFNFTFEKTADEILGAARIKRTTIVNKIVERSARIHKMREEHKVTDTVLLDIQNQMRAQAKRGIEAMSYTSNVSTNSGSEEVTIGAGVINFLLTEQDYIDAEKASVEKLDVIVRNLKDVYAYTSTGAPYLTKFKMSYEELKFLGF